ncbi:hypothetical protein DSM112329_02736 [Paraconexibacter sp. AEG42_29]|uniref:Uncharacterized protein n=1 Tax=Paraconexibacter sp. AEG42_29 TaxID=2997339 RepID=A0AAU7AW56_9ACTN
MAISFLLPLACLGLHVYQTQQHQALGDAVRTRTFWILPVALAVILLIGIALSPAITLLLCVAFMVGYPQIVRFVEDM